MNKIVVSVPNAKIDSGWLGNYVTIETGQTFVITEVEPYKLTMRELTFRERIRWGWIRFKLWIRRKING